MGNSGGQAIQLAYHRYGARCFVLVGFDFQGTHFFGEHPKEFRTTTPWDQLMLHMGPLARDLDLAGCRVVNCSPTSALRFWPKQTLAEALS